MDPSSVITQVLPSSTTRGYDESLCYFHPSSSAEINLTLKNPDVKNNIGVVAVDNGSASDNPSNSTSSAKKFFLSVICGCCCIRRGRTTDQKGSCRRRRKKRGVDGNSPLSLSDSGLRAPGLSANEIASASQQLLVPLMPEDPVRKCIVIDLDETLVHSSFKPVDNADFIVPVEIDGAIHQVYVLKRPYVDEFLTCVGQLFECVLFTASLAKYADPVTDLLDKWNVFHVRLFRESCVFHRGNYVKDLSRLGRPLDKVVIVDNSPASYVFHMSNAIPVQSWFDNMDDRELLELIPFMQCLSSSDDIYSLLQQFTTRSPSDDQTAIAQPS